VKRFAVWLLGSALLGSVVAACNSATKTPAQVDSSIGDGGTEDGATSQDASTTPDVIVHAVVDLPRSVATQGLSGTAFDEGSRTLFTIQDKRASIVPLTFSEDYRAITVGTPLLLTGRPATTWDGEGLVRANGGFIAVTNETTPTVERFDAAGAYAAAVTMPSRFAEQASGNKGLESLTLSPSGRFLFTANESALTNDGSAATKSRGTTIRILRRELGAKANADIELAYRTEPLGAGTGGDMGVSDLAALSDDVLLVLERGFQSGYGNTVRIFRVDVSSGTRVDAIPSLSSATVILAKTLVVDVVTLPADGATNPSTQPNPILDNYEALALGPVQPDGRRLLFVTSDDNGSTTQVARVLVLSVPGL
jgi:hypothetical protein